MPANLFSEKLFRCYSSENMLLLTTKTTVYIQPTDLRSNIRTQKIWPSWLTFMRQTQCLFRSVETHCFVFKGLFNIFYCFLESTEKMPLGTLKPFFPLKSTKIRDMVGCSFLITLYDVTAVALKHPACSPVPTLAGHVPLPNPWASLCFSQIVPVISKQTLYLRDWVIISLSELLPLLL